MVTSQTNRQTTTASAINNVLYSRGLGVNCQRDIDEGLTVSKHRDLERFLSRLLTALQCCMFILNAFIMHSLITNYHKVTIRTDFTRTVQNFDSLSQENYEVSRDAELSHFECNVASHVAVDHIPVTACRCQFSSFSCFEIQLQFTKFIFCCVFYILYLLYD